MLVPGHPLIELFGLDPAEKPASSSASC